MKRIKESHKRFSGNIGIEYELFSQAYPHYWNLQEAITNAIELEHKKRFLAVEIGCGPGETSEIFLRKYTNANLICIDNEKIMLSQARRNLSKYRDRIQFRNQNALKWFKNRKSKSIDVFFSGYTLHNFDKKYREELLSEIYRCLKYGGIFVNGDKYALDNPVCHAKNFNWSIQRYLDIYSKAKKEDLCYNWILHMAEDENPSKLMQEKQAKKLMKDIGFNSVKITYREHMEAVLYAKND